MSSTTLPPEIIIEGVVYHLRVEHITDGDFAGWTSIVYFNEDMEFLYPSIKVNGYIEYLVSMCPDEEYAFDDMKHKVHYGDMSKNYSLRNQ